LQSREIIIDSWSLSEFCKNFQEVPEQHRRRQDGHRLHRDRLGSADLDRGLRLLRRHRWTSVALLRSDRLQGDQSPGAQAVSGQRRCDQVFKS